MPQIVAVVRSTSVYPACHTRQRIDRHEIIYTKFRRLEPKIQDTTCNPDSIRGKAKTRLRERATQRPSLAAAFNELVLVAVLCLHPVSRHAIAPPFLHDYEADHDHVDVERRRLDEEAPFLFALEEAFGDLLLNESCNFAT